MTVYLFPPKRGDCSSADQPITQQRLGVQQPADDLTDDSTTATTRSEGKTGAAGRVRNGTSDRRTRVQPSVPAGHETEGWHIRRVTKPMIAE